MSLLASGCTDAPDPPADDSAGGATQPVTGMPADPTTVVEATSAVGLAIGASQALYASSPVIVLVAEDDEAALPDATAKAVDLGVPLLLSPALTGPASTATPAGADDDATSGSALAAKTSADGAALAAEIARLGASTVLAVGISANRWANAPVPSTGEGTDEGTPPPTLDATVVPLAASDGLVPAVHRARALGELLVLALDQPSSRAAAATARASGARVLLLADPDPRTSDDAIKALASEDTEHVLALGDAFGPAERLRRRIETAATGVLLPGGGQVVFPGRRMVALYGHPGSSVLGSLGEQPLDQAIERAKKVAASYQSLVNEPVVPAFEIIATVASASPGPDGDYSSESTIEHLRPWIDAAGKAGVYVMLDLQPGRTDFLTQAKLYTELLEEPHVGLALDPEWRLKPNQVHMVQIGSVSAKEINETAAWLAELTRKHRLPQKVLMLHQFRLDMITDRSSVNTSYDELRVVIHADGFGTAGQKYDTWNAMHINPPKQVWWGWKNFYDEDKPTFTPAETMAVEPSPVFVSYQ